MDAKQVRELRERLKMTQSELAAKVGVTDRTVRRWEAGSITVTPMAAKMLESLSGTTNPRRATGPQQLQFTHEELARAVLENLTQASRSRSKS